MAKSETSKMPRTVLVDTASLHWKTYIKSLEKKRMDCLGWTADRFSSSMLVANSWMPWRVS